ncbi:NADP-dependent 3-hydroxy acid dehydrogenase YdfG [Polaromonas sp. YR568]|uniref:SDR family NAD(P)-dependent oxidoreductase n=1 Tax=Polaromonas sp. YR568 TaxID=1855301 RepID=UPI0008F01F06|nr:SDR family NAD(P)-dependent oxidoreductase [Polaromonas sp. YR568]SFV01729.1 NADP-dependent 3-hydroxy acid dehydrogenase YdfG [Polaromonas sp. YR568]
MPLNPPISQWRDKTIWLVGASSGIGLATAKALHARGARVFVSARNAAALDAFTAVHPGATSLPLDVTDHAAVTAAAQQVQATGPLDLVLYCAGYYQAQRASDYKLAEMLRHDDINYRGALHVLDAVLPGFLARQAGHISLISSVAGYGGLPQSLAYGPTKAALNNLAETLYMDLKDSHIGVSLICPGFVETPLTAGNHFTMPALITPAQAATAILQGWEAGRFDIHFPKRFTLWMKALRLLPYPAYFAAVRKFTGL